jgi:CRP-like cAMP-binding protein
MSSTFATEEEEEEAVTVTGEGGERRERVRSGSGGLARAGSERASHASSSGASGRARDEEATPSLTTVRFGNKVVDPASGESLAQFLAGLAAWRRDIAPALAKALAATAVSSSSTSGVSAVSAGDAAGPAGADSLPEEPGRIGTKHMSAERKRAFAEGAALLQIATRLSSPAFGLIATRHTLPDSQGGQVVSAFSGADCVDWLYENVRLPTRLEATAIATRLLASDLLVRLTFASSGDASEFDSRFALFRLNKERLRGWSTTYARWSPAGGADSAPAPSSSVPSSRRWLPFLWSTPASALTIPDGPPDAEAETRSLAKSKEKEEVAEAIPAWFFSAQVTHRDWALLLAGGRVVEFPPNTVILHQQQLNDNLYRVQSGTVRVHKDDKFLVELGDCAMFGEMSVLSLDAKTTACVSAGEAGAVVTVVDIGFVHRLFTREPALARRFYHHICLTLTRIIQQLDGKQTAVPLQAMPSSEYDEALSRDAKFQRAFRLTEAQVILMDTPAMLRRLVREYGRLIVAPEYLCFEAKVFGKRTQLAVNVETIAGLKIVSRDTIEVRTSAYRRPLLFHELVDPTSVCDLLDRLRKRRGGSATAPLAAPERVISRRHPDATTDSQSLRSKASSRAAMASTTSSSGSAVADTQAQDEAGDLLSADDWSLLLVGAELRRFREGAAVLRQGVAEYTVFQIATGRLSVLIDGKCVGHMGPGETFGEISFLSQSVCSATVQVASAECTLYAMRGDSLAVLFVRKPALGGRFFQYLASILAARLKGREGKSGETDDE